MKLGIFTVYARANLRGGYKEYRVFFDNVYIGSAISIPDADQCYDIAVRARRDKVIKPHLFDRIRTAHAKAKGEA